MEEEEGGMTVDEVTSIVVNVSIARSEDIDRMHAFLRKGQKRQEGINRRRGEIQQEEEKMKQ